MKASLITMLFFSTIICSAKMVFQKEIGSKRLIVLADDDGQNQQVISDPNKDTYHPEIGSSGRFVAYSEGLIQPGGNTQLQIVIQDLENDIKEIWTPVDNQFIHVEFSGNERFLVFSGPNPETAKQNIYIVDLIEERKKGPQNIETQNNKAAHFYKPNYKILESSYDCYAPAVSSDGSTIVYHRTERKNDKQAPKQLVSFDIATSTLKELTLKDKHAMFPSLSADDRSVAYVSKDGGQWDIYVYDLWNDQKLQLTDDPEIEFTPSFKGLNKIFFTRFASGTDQLQIDIYYLNFIAFDQSSKSTSTPFLTDPSVAEYVPSFSNSNLLQKAVLPDFPKPERSSFGSVTHENLVYIAGGHQGAEHSYPRESFLNDLQVYDIKANSWSTLAPMNVAKHGFQMVAHKNFIYVFGGFTFSDKHKPKWKSVDTIERYNISTDQWHTLSTKLPRPRSSNALALVKDKVYLLGGWDSTPKFEDDKEGHFLSAIDVFDLRTESVSTIQSLMPQPLRRALTAVTSNDEIYLLGGIGEGSSHFQWIANVTVFDTSTQTWYEKSPLPFATFAPGAGIIGDSIYLMGGMILKNLGNFDLNYVDDIYRYDFVTNEWTHSGVYLDENKGFPQVVPLSDSKLGILGGHTYIFSSGRLVDHPVSTFETLEF